MLFFIPCHRLQTCVHMLELRVFKASKVLRLMLDPLGGELKGTAIDTRHALDINCGPIYHMPCYELTN